MFLACCRHYFILSYGQVVFHSLSLSLYIYIYIYTHTHHTFSFSLYISIFFIHSSVDGHLSCFYILAIINNATNINAHVSLHVSVFVLVIYPEVEMLGHGVVLDFSFFFKFYFIFKLYIIVLVLPNIKMNPSQVYTSMLFSTVAAPLYTPINSVPGFLNLHILGNICYLWGFVNDSHLTGVK